MVYGGSRTPRAGCSPEGEAGVREYEKDHTRMPATSAVEFNCIVDVDNSVDS